MSTFPFFLSQNPAWDPARLAPALTRSRLGPVLWAPPEQSSPEGLVPAKESLRDAHRIARSRVLFKRQGASEGVSRRMSSHVAATRRQFSSRSLSHDV